jgi:hypothetical protein
MFGCFTGWARKDLEPTRKKDARYSVDRKNLADADKARKAASQLGDGFEAEETR